MFRRPCRRMSRKSSGSADGIIEFPQSEWRSLLDKVKNGVISVQVSAWNEENPEGIMYRSFDIKVSDDLIDGWLTYRLIEPGYVEWRQMGIYQRNLSTFEEIPVVTNRESSTNCVLLALSETGRLADDAFLYGLSGSSDFVFGNTENVMSRNFNMNFYSTSGLVNPTVYYAFQQATQFVLGMNFDSARCLADTYLKVGDYALAKKYLDILSHSSCHGKWVRDRLDKLESIRDAVPEYRVDEKHIWGNFVYDMSLMHERCPEDRRFADFLLCALLADRNKDLFYKYFQDVAAEHYQSSIPRLYQEILLLIAQEEPEAASRYEISEELRDQYKNFVYLVSSGREKVARKRYSGTYWAYLYFQNHKHP